MIENLVEWRQFGWNIETYSAAGIFLFTVLEAWLFYRQNKIVWRKRSGQSMSADLFVFLPFIFISFIIYGLSGGEGMLAVNGLLFLFIIPITVGLIKFNGFLARYAAWFVICTAGLALMVFLPFKDLFYLLFAAGNIIFLVMQLKMLWQSGKPGVLDIWLVIVYFFGSILWAVYALLIPNWFLFFIAVLSSAILGTIIFIWLYLKRQEKSVFGDARNGTRSSRLKIGFRSCDKKWQEAPATFDGHNLKIQNHPVMEDWEAGYMKELTAIVCSGGGHILEVGFGMGISADYIQAENIKTHTIIEANREVYQRLLKFAEEPRKKVIPKFGFWQEVIKYFSEGSFDGILFDTYPLNEKEVHKNHFNFFKEAYRLLKPGGVFSYYSDEINEFSLEHLKMLYGAGFSDINSSICEVCPPSDCQYWQSATILAPIIRKKGV